MKKSYFLLGLLFSILISCNPKSQSNTEIPACIQSKIDEFKAQPPQNPPVEIWKWTKKDGTDYYYITSPCCDQYNYIHNENCEEVCAPDGGISGEGDGECPDLKENVVQTFIWKDDRQPEEQTEQQRDKTKLNQQLASIKQLANSVECTNEEEWEITAYGSKPCGGPWGFIAYHPSIDVDHFMQLIKQHKEAEQEYNQKYGVVSDCMVEMKPEKVECENGKAVLNNSD